MQSFSLLVLLVILNGVLSIRSVPWSRDLQSELALRAQLCPQVPANLRYQFRYHNESGSCHKVGSTGPCFGDNMAFFASRTNAVYGECDCNYNDNSRALILSKNENGDEHCHFVYTKGQCKEGQWLVFHPSSWTPTCESNKCLRHYDNISSRGKGQNAILENITKGGKSVSVEFVPFRNSCVPFTLSCSSDEDVAQEDKRRYASLRHMPHQVQFIKGKVAPRCAPEDLANWRYPTPKMRCLPGSKLFSDGRCGLEEIELEF